DVTRVVLALEVVERAQQEVALLLERRERVLLAPVERGARVARHARTRLGGGHGSARRARATSSRSASVASKRSSRRHRRKTATSRARGTTDRPTGMIHTSPATPVARGV